jgi:hypothetical protein
MKVALGLKAHSGWAALVAIGRSANGLEVVDRRRLELVEHTWAKAPYHAAEKVSPGKANALVKRGIEEAYRVAEEALRAAVAGLDAHEIVGCAILTPNPMPDWTTDEILAVHFRMHKAEGVLFPDALARAAKACGLRLVAVPEKTLSADASTLQRIAALGKSVGAPWGKDQKTAALAAIQALAK